MITALKTSPPRWVSARKCQCTMVIMAMKSESLWTFPAFHCQVTAVCTWRKWPLT